MVKGVLTVVDLATPGRRGTKKGRRDGINLDETEAPSSVVVMAGVTPSCITVVPR